jgi:hypothetical protein
VGTRRHEGSGDDPVPKRSTLPVDVIEKSLEGAYSLSHPLGEAFPFEGSDDAGNEIERERALLARVSEGHPPVKKGALKGVRALA